MYQSWSGVSIWLLRRLSLISESVIAHPVGRLIYDLPAEKMLLFESHRDCSCVHCAH